MFKLIASCAAFASLSAIPTYAAAQEKLPPEAGVVTMTRYLLPIALDGVLPACAAHLEPDSYLMANADTLRQKFDDAAEGTFEVARMTMFTLGGGGRGLGGQLTADLQDVSEPEFREEMQSIIAQDIFRSMDQQTCEIADRMLEDLEPLPTENLASILGYLLYQIGLSEQGPR